MLLAEPDSVERALLASALDEDGYEVTEVGTAEQLLALVEQAQRTGRPPGPFDALIVGVSLPGASGQSLLAQLRRLDPDVPMVVLAAEAEEHSHATAFESGADAVVDRPLELDTLRTVLRIIAPPRCET